MNETDPILELQLWQQLQTVRVNREFVNVFTNTREMGQCKQRTFTGGAVNVLLVSFTDISSPAVRRTRGARTEKSC